MPEPDSPTIASVSPRSKLKEISRTAFTVPLTVRKEIFRSFTCKMLSAIDYSSTPLSEGLNASLNPLPNKLKQIMRREMTIAGKIIR